MKKPKISLIITTFNRPDFLLLSLNSVNNQTIVPDEVIIADDGSDEKTKMAINSVVPVMKMPVHHVWQPNQGFRAGAIRNKALHQCIYPYVVQIDGDIICHKEFVRDHCDNCKHGYFLTGKRINLNADDTASSLFEAQLFCSPRSIGGNKFSHRHRNLFLAALVKTTQVNRFYQKGVLGSNMSYWRDDAMAINGYNEKMEGWGKEDDEFGIRLNNLGVKKRALRFSAIQYHLYHQLNSRANLAQNKAILDESILYKKKLV